MFNLLHVADVTHTPSFFLGTDVEKAFDWVNGRFMFAVLRHIGLGDNMIH